ncbi:MAG: hypothetical protein KatS3mg031_1992 [Chitinophagales bacterium]|nr:MAG: hypothetical protein KatS3mg031_1992 [Chitinophagales bacterium]
MQNIFKDSSINQAIEKNGFAVIPFIDSRIAEELKRFYASLPAAQGATGTHVTMFNPSSDYRRKVHEKISELCGSRATQLTHGYRVLYTNFMIKEPGPEGNFPVHQDWTYVDEKQYTSIAFWIPLHDVDARNGALHVVRGSHHFLTALRGPYVHEPFQHLSDVIKNHFSEPVNLKAGEALVWDHRLIHFSLPNLTSQPRLAFTLIMVPQQAPVCHCYGLPESQGTLIELYEVDTEFYMHYTIGQRPQGVKLLTTIKQPALSFTPQQFETTYFRYNRPGC